MDALCQFAKQEEGTNVCRVCGLRAPKLAVRPVANCRGHGGLPSPPSQPPSFLTRVSNFATSAVKHVAAGAPRCTDEEVASRHAICAGCEYFDGKSCTKCGCPVSRERAYISKLSWAGESCPVGKWGPVVRPENKG